jgi:hypothetical protein
MYGGGDQDQQEHERLKAQDGLQALAPRPMQGIASVGSQDAE